MDSLTQVSLDGASLEASPGFMHPGQDSWAHETGAELAFLDTARWLPEAVGPVSSSTSHVSAGPQIPAHVK